MKNFKRTLAFISAVSLMGTLTACQSGEPAQTASVTSETTAPKELDEADKEIVNQIDAGADEKLENPTVKWLSWYDINPDKGKPKLAALEMFENQYGGKIEYIYANNEGGEIYDKLSSLLTGGDAPDLFPAQEFDTFPNRALEDMFMPWDEYLDFNDPELWTNGAKQLSDLHTLGGKHFVTVTETDSRCIVIYNQKTIDENGLDDPAKLLEEGNWTWDTFRKMCVDFCNRDEGKFAYDSWFFEQNILLTTGVAPITNENGVIKNNILSPEIERAENFMYDLKKDDLPLPKPEFGWVEQPNRVAEGLTLFYPKGTWTLWETDLSHYGELEDIRFVPMPRDPKADKYYLPASVDAYALCKGAKNPEGAAAYMKCKLIAAKNPDAIALNEKQNREDYGWTDNMVDMWYTVRELTDANPMVSLHTGLDSIVSPQLDDALKQASFNGKEWSVTTGEIGIGVQNEVDRINKVIEEKYPQ